MQACGVLRYRATEAGTVRVQVFGSEGTSTAHPYALVVTARVPQRGD